MKQEPRLQLSSELANRGSGLNAIIDITTNAVDRGAIGATSHVARARKLIAQACPVYTACSCSPNCLLCRSGENGKEPLRGKDCRKCSVSQLSPTGVFVGNIKRDLTRIKV